MLKVLNLNVKTSERLQTAGPFPIAPLCGIGVYKSRYFLKNNFD